MDLHLTLVLLSIAVVCLGLAMLIGHVIASRVLAVGGTVLGGVVLVASLLA
jgi:hypothetical protein